MSCSIKSLLFPEASALGYIVFIIVVVITFVVLHKHQRQAHRSILSDSPLHILHHSRHHHFHRGRRQHILFLINLHQQSRCQRLVVVHRSLQLCHLVGSLIVHVLQHGPLLHQLLKRHRLLFLRCLPLLRFHSPPQLSVWSRHLTSFLHVY